MSVLLNILTAIRLKKDEVIGKMYWNSKGIDKMLALAAYLSGFVIIEKEISFSLKNEILFSTFSKKFNRICHHSNVFVLVLLLTVL